MKSSDSRATLKINGVTQDLTDPTTRHRFVLQFNRDLTPTERDCVVQKLTLRFRLQTEEHGPDTVVILNGTEGWFTHPPARQQLKAAIAEAEAEAEKHLAQDSSAEGRAAARDDETRRRLEAIDWDDDSE